MGRNGEKVCGGRPGNRWFSEVMDAGRPPGLRTVTGHRPAVDRGGRGLTRPPWPRVGKGGVLQKKMRQNVGLLHFG